MTLILRCVGLDVDDETAREIANEVYGVVDDRGHDLKSVEPVPDRFVLVDEAGRRRFRQRLSRAAQVDLKRPLIESRKRNIRTLRPTGPFVFEEETTPLTAQSENDDTENVATNVEDVDGAVYVESMPDLSEWSGDKGDPGPICPDCGEQRVEPGQRRTVCVECAGFDGEGSE